MSSMYNRLLVVSFDVCLYPWNILSRSDSSPGLQCSPLSLIAAKHDFLRVLRDMDAERTQVEHQNHEKCPNMRITIVLTRLSHRVQAKPGAIGAMHIYELGLFVKSNELSLQT